MTLDLNLVAAQIMAMAEGMEEAHRDWEGRLRNAIEALHAHAADPVALQRRIAASKTTWLPAGIVDALDNTYPVPTCSSDFTVIATDGSHIDVDRHRPLRCCLINIGEVILQYGANPKAYLGSKPTLYSRREELEFTDSSGAQRQEIEGAILAARRMVLEVAALVPLAQDAGGPTVGLLDGSLILWGLAGRATPDFVRRALLDEDLLKSLDWFKEKSVERPLAVASYISFPRATDVVDALRIACCPYHPVDCDHHCPGKRFSERPCDSVGGLVDRDLFGRLLKPGERSPVFASLSRIVRDYYRQHEVYFFYLMADEEVARVEISRWVAESKLLLDLVHALVLDQCRRGHGYPLALSEAHEKAVINGADREYFWHFVDKVLSESHLSTRTSAKSGSKRKRWV